MNKFDISAFQFGGNNDFKNRIFIPTTNAAPRLAITLALDTSGSMSGRPISELNKGLRLFYEQIRKAPHATDSAELCIVTFGHGGVTLAQNFAPLNRVEPPVLSADGLTPMGEAVELALNTLEARTKLYRRLGCSQHRPWLVLMSDGEPTDNIVSAASRSKSMEASGMLSVYSVGVRGANLNVLDQFSCKRQAMAMRDLGYVEFFDWLSRSTTIVSKSTPGCGDSDDLMDKNMRGWLKHRP